MTRKEYLAQRRDRLFKGHKWKLVPKRGREATFEYWKERGVRPPVGICNRQCKYCGYTMPLTCHIAQGPRCEDRVLKDVMDS